MKPKIIFEDENLLVLDKPAGMIVNRSDTTKGEETLQDFVEEYLKIGRSEPKIDKTLSYEDQARLDFVNRAGIVHRLDKETSGIILVAKTSDAFLNLQAQFRERKVQKTYIALSHGKVEPEAGEINVSVGRLPWNRKRFGVVAEGKESVTQYKALSIKYLGKNREPLTLVELHPKSGRTHQIRVHLQYIHHPIFSDPLYAGRKTSRYDRKLLSRVFLHASKISFFHPARHASQVAGVAGKPKNSELLSFESPLPSDLKQFIASLNS
ncbi:MAG: RluA family pseudouridine synthase [Candidatus Levybacteria bacterium]|nr:RluA family pseudouridine synthase [Candidatus Levybacteria bacterium]